MATYDAPAITKAIAHSFFNTKNGPTNTIAATITQEDAYKAMRTLEELGRVVGRASDSPPNTEAKKRIEQCQTQFEQVLSTDLGYTPTPR